MSDELKNAVYDKLTPQRKLLVDAVLKNLEKGTGLWEQGWSGGVAPVSAITGKPVFVAVFIDVPKIVKQLFLCGVKLFHKIIIAQELGNGNPCPIQKTERRRI